MKALVYGVPPEPFEVPDNANPLTQNLARTPTALRQLPDPQLPHEDWVITRPRLTGVCGSDSKQILMDFGDGDSDNAWPHFALSRKSWATRWSPTWWRWVRRPAGWRSGAGRAQPVAVVRPAWH